MELDIILMNLAYTTIGSTIALFFMLVGYKLFDYLTPFNTHDQLEQGNVAVGIVIGSIFIGLGLAVGLVVGMGLN